MFHPHCQQSKTRFKFLPMLHLTTAIALRQRQRVCKRSLVSLADASLACHPTDAQVLLVKGAVSDHRGVAGFFVPDTRSLFKQACPQAGSLVSQRFWTNQTAVVTKKELVWSASAARARDGRMVKGGTDKVAWFRTEARHSSSVWHCAGQGTLDVGSRAVNWGGGGSIEPPKTEGGGSGKRAQLTGPLISYYELWRQRRRKFFCALKMVNFFFTKYIPNDDFSEPPSRTDSKNPIFIFLSIVGSGSPPRPRGQSR